MNNQYLPQEFIKELEVLWRSYKFLLSINQATQFKGIGMILRENCNFDNREEFNVFPFNQMKFSRISSVKCKEKLIVFLRKKGQQQLADEMEGVKENNFRESHFHQLAEHWRKDGLLDELKLHISKKEDLTLLEISEKNVQARAEEIANEVLRDLKELAAVELTDPDAVTFKKKELEDIKLTNHYAMTCKMSREIIEGAIAIVNDRHTNVEKAKTWGNSYMNFLKGIEQYETMQPKRKNPGFTDADDESVQRQSKIQKIEEEGKSHTTQYSSFEEEDQSHTRYSSFE